MVRVLSFDVGIRHLAFCALEGSQPSIARWELMDLGKVHGVEACALKLTQELESRFGADEAYDVVLVERQPKSRSIMMVAIQMILCAFFTARRVRGSVGEVRFAHAGRKLVAKHFAPETPAGDVVEDARQRYAKNKRYAVLATRHYLEHVHEDFGSLVLLDMFPKKDDLCDAYMQAITFLETRGAAQTLPRFCRKDSTRKGRRGRNAHPIAL